MTDVVATGIEGGTLTVPKVFISYRWSSPRHEAWVLQLATDFRANGIEAILDKWHLKEGQDAYAFMERMATDSDVAKVLLICDQGYVDRADKREGGVGIETQIVSPQVYEKSDQTKFAAIVLEFDADGKPFLPVYMKSRLYFDFSDEDAFSANFEKTVRWVFDKPFYAVPPIGNAPEFLKETYSANSVASQSVTVMRASRLVSDARYHSAANAVLDAAVAGVDSLRLNLASEPEGDQAVVDTIKGSLPLREQVFEAFDSLIQAATPQSSDQIHRFLEEILIISEKIPMNTQCSRFDNDVVKFLRESWLLGFVALALKHRQFSFATDMLSTPFYKTNYDSKTGSAVTYSEFGANLDSLQFRKQRLKINRISLYADLVSELSQTSLIKFPAILEADFTLYLRSILTVDSNNSLPRWYPETLVFATNEHGSFPTYARASSRTFYDRLKSFLGNLSADEVRAALQPYKTGLKKNLRFDFWEVNTALLSNADNLATMP